MGSFVAYTFQAGVYLLAGYIIYKWLLAAENQPSFNRAVLLAIYAVSFVAPLVALPEWRLPHDGALAAGQVSAGELSVAGVAGGVPAWAVVCVWVYLAGAAVAAVATAVSFVRLFAIIRRGDKQSRGPYTLIIKNDTPLATFSWLRYIVMSRGDFDEAGDTILLHESAHLRLHHWADLLIAQAAIVALWYNPAAWLMRAELRSVHEYQADDAVLRSGANARQYQLMLIKKAAGQRFPSLANSLNHSKLKNRITMMCNQKSSPARRLRALALAPAVLLAAVAVNIPSVASALGTASSVSLSDSKISEKIPAAQTPAPQAAAQAQQDEDMPQPDVLPEYPGGMPEMFKFLAAKLNYPVEAAQKGIQGKVVVGFVINEQGKPVDVAVIQPVSPDLDAEAIRVIGSMPAWKPATKDGKTVRCKMALPVNFKLPKPKKTK